MEQAPAAMRERKRAARISKDGKWRSFHKFPNLLQYINTQTYYARIKVSGKLIRQSLNTDVWSTTRCIESGVDIPTVSRWLGHKDGGALAMRVSGHLRNEHSQQMAQKVRF